MKPEKSIIPVIIDDNQFNNNNKISTITSSNKNHSIKESFDNAAFADTEENTPKF